MTIVDVVTIVNHGSTFALCLENGEREEKDERREMKGSRVISLIWMLSREKSKMWTHNLLGPFLAICPI